MYIIVLLGTRIECIVFDNSSIAGLVGKQRLEQQKTTRSDGTQSHEKEIERPREIKVSYVNITNPVLSSFMSNFLLSCRIFIVTFHVLQRGLPCLGFRLQECRCVLMIPAGRLFVFLQQVFSELRYYQRDNHSYLLYLEIYCLYDVTT